MRSAQVTTTQIMMGLRRGGRRHADSLAGLVGRAYQRATGPSWGGCLRLALVLMLFALAPVPLAVQAGQPAAGAATGTGTRNSWAATGWMSMARGSATATLLPNGTVLVAGGIGSTCRRATCFAINSAELYNPTSGTWTPTGSMGLATAYHTATLLQTGQVLVVGGCSENVCAGAYNQAQLYNPATGTWTFTGSMAADRAYHTATLLPNGQVLAAGGVDNNGNALASAELYDPTSGTWASTGSMITARNFHTATLLPDGQVLVAGGSGTGIAPVASTELYNPSTGTWMATGRMVTPRYFHTATLLPNGKVLVAGGTDSALYLSSAELYDPKTGTWTATGRMTTARAEHTATLLPNGQVLVAGGCTTPCNWLPIASAELYDPHLGGWSPTGAMTVARVYHTATLLPSGQVLVAGGSSDESELHQLTSAELYTPGPGPLAEITPFDLNFGSQPVGTRSAPLTATLTNIGQMPLSVSSVVVSGTNAAEFALTSGCTAAPVAPGGHCALRVVFTPAGSNLRRAELVLTDNAPGSPRSVPLRGIGSGPGTWTPTGLMLAGRENHTATLLPGGQVLVAGGYGGAAVATSELYDPGTGTWSAAGNMTTARTGHTATLLPNGQVLVAGGSYSNCASCNSSSAELYNPRTGTWTATGSMAVARAEHTATLLPNGQVLVAGGWTCCDTQSNNSITASAELYDPSTGTWRPTGSMTSVRAYYTATRLANGSVLVAGGTDNTGYPLASAELYDPSTGTWTATASMATTREYHTATLLHNGQVLVAGGKSYPDFTANAELYNPTTRTWIATGTMNMARGSHTATLLRDGRVLVAGGSVSGSNGTLSSAELYGPGTGTWSVTGSLITGRMVHTATLLPDEHVLVAGGCCNDEGIGSTALASAELYTPSR